MRGGTFYRGPASGVGHSNEIAHSVLEQRAVRGRTAGVKPRDVDIKNAETFFKMLVELQLCFH